MKILIAIDPGSVHVGASIWTDNGGEGWSCQRSREFAPEAWADWLRDYLSDSEAELELCYEIFRLAAGPSLTSQIGKTFGEVEVIGQTRLLCRWADVPVHGVDRSFRASARKRGDALKYKWRANGHGDHAKDAEATAIAFLKLDATGIKRASILPT